MDRRLALITLALFVIADPAVAQSTPEDYRDEFASHFDRSSRKLVLLSEAIPEDLYAWSPGEGVMSIGRVYAHIARYNYLYLEESLGIEAPQGVEWQDFESITDKATIVALLGQSIEHVRKSVKELDEADLTRPAMLYGRQVAGWAVLFQLLAHMNEHVGQSVAYARMNDIVPPWSR
jgi:uncharacterized damage-inducible protein DinB